VRRHLVREIGPVPSGSRSRHTAVSEVMRWRHACEGPDLERAFAEDQGYNRPAPGSSADTVDRLRRAGVHLRSELITGVGGKQVVIDDPSGNPVELFEPTRAEARLTKK